MQFVALLEIYGRGGSMTLPYGKNQNYPTNINLPGRDAKRSMRADF